MAVLVSHDVPLREWPALGAEALCQLLKEADVEIDLLVVRAIEGSHRGFGEAARALGRVGIENSLRREIGIAAARELVGPILLDAVDETNDAAVVALVGIGTSLAILHRGRAVDGGVRPPVVGKWIHTEQQRDDQDDESEPAASDDDRTAETAAGSAASALVFDLRRIEGRVASECHARTQPQLGGQAA